MFHHGDLFTSIHLTSLTKMTPYLIATWMAALCNQHGKEFLYKGCRYIQSVEWVMSKPRVTQSEKNMLNVGNPKELTWCAAWSSRQLSYTEKYRCKSWLDYVKGSVIYTTFIFLGPASWRVNRLLHSSKLCNRKRSKSKHTDFLLH